MTGETVLDRFRLLERIGSGGMGTVYRAFDERLQRHVAVKEVMVGDPGRVVREAQAAARLNHPGIVTLFELGLDGHRALLVSELVSGSTLEELAREGELCDRDVAELGADICEALAHAHQHGVIHRDLKPQNVIARDDDGAGRRAKLMDFGVASLAGAATLTATGEVVGTLAYMSPEQAEGERAEAASDTYSLALTLYECWAGENPVRRATPAQTARALGSEIPSLADYRPDLPSRLCEAVDGCLRPEATERASLDGLHRELERAIPELDDTYRLPTPDGVDSSSRGDWLAGAASRVPVLVLVAACAALAGPAALPGLALLTAILCLPALVFASGPERAALPALVLPLGTISAGAAYPAAADLLEPPPANWDASLGATWDALLVPLLAPASLAGLAAFGAGAAVLGRVLEARELAMSMLGALLWAAALAAALRLVGDGGLAFAPVLVAASAALAVAAARRPRGPRPRFRGHSHQPAEAPLPRPVPSAGA